MSQNTNEHIEQRKYFWNYYEGKEIGEIWGYEANGFYTVDDLKAPRLGY